MYTFYILICFKIIITLNFYRYVKAGKVTFENKLLYSSLLVFVSTFIIGYLAIGFDLTGSEWEYFPGLFINDSARYIAEVQHFSGDILSVDEFNGNFHNYQVTAKFGLPSIIANLNYFGIENPYFYYFIMLLTVTSITFYSLNVYYKLCSLTRCNRAYFGLFFLLIFLFPVDYYWFFRFLREPIANALLIASAFSLLAYFYLSKKNLTYFILFSLLLLFFRAQLFLLVFVLSLILLLYNLKGNKLLMWVLLALLFLCFRQSLSASGFASLKSLFIILNLEFIGEYIHLILNSNVYLPLYILLLSTAMVSFFLKHKLEMNSITPSPSFVIFILGGLFYLCIILDIQIRFFYPILIFLKVLIFLAFFSEKKRFIFY
ncbi:hypothetical protein APQ14_00845 [Vibrio toranzoniae]|uniref:Uncharacterized protein n=1 Tax=Vibrio toranzoniae TaxID=1194427 RepID=A0A109DBX4_9VIBR|nr:hypothetical protein [Vibrio toranzoniae]KWU02527.1 hypothetical protein APQ14_00845 [Vibrio toranzoniae]SBS37142.1 hypothetical protein VTO7225_02648 [Vibrio toranzoniae]